MVSKQCLLREDIKLLKGWALQIMAPKLNFDAVKYLVVPNKTGKTFFFTGSLKNKPSICSGT